MTPAPPRRLRVVAALLVATAALAACSSHSDAGDRARVGDVVIARGASLGPTATVRVPSGVVTVRIGSPVTVEEPNVGHPDAAERAPHGGGWVAVGLTYAPSTDDRPPLPFAELDDHPPTFSVRTPSGTYPLGQPLGSTAVEVPETGVPQLRLPDTFAVAVPDTGRQAQVLVTYDGFSQAVSPDGAVARGSASALAHPPTSVAVSSCGSVAWKGAHPLTPFACHAKAAIAPYDARAGWAPAGRQWLLLDLDVDFGRLPERNGIEYDDTRTRLVGDGDRLSGIGPGRVVSRHSQYAYAGHDDAQRVEVWAVPTDETGGRVRLRAVVRDPTTHQRFALHTSITLTTR